MTVASEISRLQQAKSDIKTAIESKGVSVGSSTKLDCMANCINSISIGGCGNEYGYIDILAIGGGGGGGGKTDYSYGGGGGGAGELLYENCYLIFHKKNYNITIGTGGTSSKNGGDTIFGNITLYGGGAGGAGGACGCDGGNGGGASGYPEGCMKRGGEAKKRGHSGGFSASCRCYSCTGGGGGVCGRGGSTGGMEIATTQGVGGIGICSNITGSYVCYGGGGGGGGGRCNTSSYCGCYGGGNGGKNAKGTNATTYGSGGGGGGCSCLGGNGCQGIVIIRYKTDGSCGIKSATGGTKYTCGDYTIHCFTSNDTFSIVS